jgi:hypothetical protein
MKTSKSKSPKYPSLAPLPPAGKRSIGATAKGGGTKSVDTNWGQPPGPRLVYEPDCALVALLQSTGNSPAGEALGLLAAAGLFAAVAKEQPEDSKLRRGLERTSENLYRQAIERATG